MNASALELAGLFGKGLTEEQGERAAGLLDSFVSRKIKERTADTIADRVELQVDRSVLERSKELATKGDVHVLKEDIVKLEGRLDKLDGRVVSGFIAVLLGIIALMATMIWGFQSIRAQGNAPVAQQALP